MSERCQHARGPAIAALGALLAAAASLAPAAERSCAVCAGLYLSLPA